MEWNDELAVEITDMLCNLPQGQRLERLREAFFAKATSDQMRAAKLALQADPQTVAQAATSSHHS
ncbi:MAG TPA: hypothetical protein VF169_08140 [Albitalea sp.]|uniref:hypothetical protein n=1 Tax=Piscinibacter sp. TaxID=1903157 RepID=UPI002ED2AF06